MITRILLKPLTRMGGVFLAASLFFLLFISSAFAETAELGQPAPNFKTVDTQGISHQLSDYKGKTVVLEWSNPYCPYVKKHYKRGNMPMIQQKALAEDKDRVWLTVLSSARGTPGHVSSKKAEKLFLKKYHGKASAILMDENGNIGKSYGAKTTPHMFIINPKGVLVYAGAIDDQPSTKTSSLKGAKNYVLTALSELKKGDAISTPHTRAYGCAVHY